MPAWREQPALHAAAAIVLGAVIFWRGLLPSLAGPETDFQNYYTASRLLLEGAPLERCYDTAWFQQQMIRFGFTGQGKFSPFPPSTALLLLPVAWMNPGHAFHLLTLANLIALVGCFLLFRALTGLHPATSALAILAAGLGIINGFRFGQMYFFVALLMLLSLWWLRRGSQGLAGVAAGLMIPVKYFPVVLLVWFLWDRKWTAAASAALTAAGITVLSIGLMGTGVFSEYAASVLPGHLLSRYPLQSPFSASFQSWDSLLMRLFVRDAAENAGALVDSRFVYHAAKAMILGAGALVIVYQALTAERSPAGREMFLALLGTGALLFAPGTATYHFVLLWLPLVLVINHHTISRTLSAAAIFTYAAIGWIPYGWFRPFESAGGVGVLLAYPRLFLLSGLFVLLLALLRRTEARPA